MGVQMAVKPSKTQPKGGYFGEISVRWSKIPEILETLKKPAFMTGGSYFNQETSKSMISRGQHGANPACRGPIWTKKPPDLR